MCVGTAHLVLNEPHRLVVSIALDDDHARTKLVEYDCNRVRELVVRSQIGETRCN